ncbi:MAG: S-layer homology domain-containing protein, partial [Acidimicrobiales bacterium]
PVPDLQEYPEKLQRRRTARRIAGVLAIALALSASPLIGVELARAADALPPLADPIADGAFCEGGPGTNPFTDLGAEAVANREAILCLVATGLTSGTTATTYTPEGTVTRRQMALFITRLADLLNDLENGSTPLAALPTYDGTSDFDDVAADDPGAAAIGQLSQADIVGGFSDGTFRPNDLVSRRQMAAFVNNLQDFLAGDPYTTTKDFFTDDSGDTGEDNLNALASVGIFQGDGQGNVVPGDDLTRRQMANILLRDAQVYLSADDIDSPFLTGTNALWVMTPKRTIIQELVGEPKAGPTRLYTVRGLMPGTTYVIQLFPGANVQGTSSLTFTEDGVTNTAAVGTVAATITQVNGAAATAPLDANATGQPVGSTLTFTVDGSAVETIVPVLYKDGDGDGKLDLKADNTPVATEPFSVGGRIRYLPPEQASGPSAFTVTAVAAERDAFVSGAHTYYFDANDTYQYNGAAITAAQFDSILSVGDVGAATYNPDPASVSTFNITTDDVDAPATPTVAVINSDAEGSANDARVTYTRPATNAPGVTYVLQRAEVTPLIPMTCGVLGDTVGPFATVATATQAAGT